MSQAARWGAVLVVFLIVQPIRRAEAQFTDWSSLPYTDFKTLETVDSTGSPTYDPSLLPGKVLGVVLNNPTDMTDSMIGTEAQPPTSDPSDAFNPDPYWQVYVQTVDVNHTGDFGGAAVFLAQNYGAVPPYLTFPGGVPTPDPTASYTADQWTADVLRVSNNQTLKAGDLIEVQAQGGLSFGGKFFINEEHEANNPDTTFNIVIVDPNYGLPSATPLHLADIWDNTADSVLFDPTRALGGERFESTLVRLLNVSLVSGVWQANGLVTVSDSSGRTFPLQLGNNPGFSSEAAPVGTFSITGIFDKESSSAGPYNTGYQLWAMDPTSLVLGPIANSFTWKNTSGDGPYLIADASNWVEGVAPTGSVTDSLTFGNAATASFTATVYGANGPRTFNNLGFVNIAGVAATIQSSNNGGLTLDGVAPAITQLGDGDVNFNVPIHLNAGVAINGSGLGNMTFNGPLTLAPAVSLTKSTPGLAEISAAATLGDRSSLQISAGVLRLNVTSGAATVGTGVTATIGSAGTLELAGTVSALSDSTSGNLASIANDGLLHIVGPDQQLGAISGAGTLQVDSGARFLATGIIQNSLVIGGTADSAALLTIAPSSVADGTDSAAGAISGGPLASSGSWPQNSLFAMAAADAPSSAAAASILAVEPTADIGGESPPASGNASNPVVTAVPEPPGWLLAAIGALGSWLFLRRHIAIRATAL